MRNGQLLPGPLRVMLRLSVLVLFSGITTSAGVGNFCPIGNCVINNPVYVNVYWDSSPATWDADVMSTDATMTQARIDAITRAMLASGYFGPMGPDYKVRSATWGGSMTVACGGAPANVDASFDKLKDLAQCVFNVNPALNNESTVLNVFLPPKTINTAFCNPASDGSHAAALHDKFGSPVAITVLPTVMACIGSFNGLIVALSHEMVEAATDPNPASPTGFKTFDLTGTQEIGDLCETIASVPFLFSRLTQYWSNAANACIHGVGTAMPSISNASVCGWGKHMTVNITGTFEGKPWDLSSLAFADQTLYLRAAVSGGHTWSAGNIVGTPADPVLLADISWTPSLVSIGGFKGTYGSSGMVVGPADTVTFTVFSQASGLSSTTAVTAPSPTALVFRSPNPMFPESTQALKGSVVDGSQCALENVAVALSAASGNISSTVNTDDSGNFSSPFTAPAVAGLVNVKATTGGTIAANTKVTVAPQATALTSDIGSAAGGQTITLSGAGFDASTSIHFGSITTGNSLGTTATIKSVATDHHSVTLVTPPSPNPGDGSGFAVVTATVNGITSAPLNYRYIIAGKPVLVDNSNPCKTPPTIVTATIYNADGSNSRGKIDLTASYPAFVVAGHNVTSLTVTSGSSVTVTGDGPVTATNRLNRASTTLYFPACLQHPFPDKAQFIPFYNPIIPEQQVTWINGGDPQASSDFVTMFGPPEQLAVNYSVRPLGQNELQQLIQTGAVVMNQNQKLEAVFTGKAVTIMHLGEAARIAPANGTISFVRPRGGVANPNKPNSGLFEAPQYEIVRFAQHGKSFSWSVVKGSKDQPRTGLVTAPGAAPGIYALVAVKPQRELPTTKAKAM